MRVTAKCEFEYRATEPGRRLHGNSPRPVSPAGSVVPCFTTRLAHVISSASTAVIPTRSSAASRPLLKWICTRHCLNCRTRNRCRRRSASLIVPTVPPSLHWMQKSMLESVRFVAPRSSQEPVAVEPLNRKPYCHFRSLQIRPGSPIKSGSPDCGLHRVRLSRYARDDNDLNGVYVPYWTYDSDTVTAYSGQRGDVYYVKERYVTYQNGRRVTRTRSVPKVRWTPVSGRTRRHFDDVLVGATRTLPRKITDWLQPWDLQNLVPFTEEYLSGFSSEVYQVNLDRGF